MNSVWRRFSRNDRGATAIEYGLIASLVIVVILAMVVAVGGENGDLWERIGTEVGSALGSG